MTRSMSKVWRYKDYPLISIGQLVLDRNPQNFLQTLAGKLQSSTFVPHRAFTGQVASGRLFSYPDTQRHGWCGKIPVNCPYCQPASNYQRDGQMRADGNGVPLRTIPQ
jgi:catalase